MGNSWPNNCCSVSSSSQNREEKKREGIIITSIYEDNTSESSENDQHHHHHHHHECLEESNSIAFPSSNLRQNLMREQHGRDIRDYYEVLDTLGIGSMGSVCRAHKRSDALGGSARISGTRNDSSIKMPPWKKKLTFWGRLLASLEYPQQRQKQQQQQQQRQRKQQQQQPALVLSNATSSNVSLCKTESSICHQSDSTTTITTTTTATAAQQQQQQPPQPPTYEIECAVKSIHLNRISEPKFISELRNEIDILKTLDHPNIVRPIETFQLRNEFFVVMELCNGGDLYTRDPYTEPQAARILYKILSAVAYMHQFNIVHRDLKYENVMFADQSEHSEVKLIDFGLSKKFTLEQPHIYEGVGTIYTMAPQVMKGVYTVKADLWSIGVLAFMLLSSQMPFYGKTRTQVVQRIMKCQYSFESHHWTNISPSAKAFVSSLLQLDPDLRPSAEEAMKSSWFEQIYPIELRHPSKFFMKHVCNTMKQFTSYPKLKQLALMVIAHKSTYREIGPLHDAFAQYDQRRDGIVSFEEFKLALSEFGYSIEQLKSIFDSVDLGQCGSIHYTEFLAATLEAQGEIEEERIAEAFDRLDTDGSGFISKTNLREILGETVSEEQIDEIFNEVPRNDDNVTKQTKSMKKLGRNENRGSGYSRKKDGISYDDFLRLWDKRKDCKFRHSFGKDDDDNDVARIVDDEYGPPQDITSIIQRNRKLAKSDSVQNVNTVYSDRIGGGGVDGVTKGEQLLHPPLRLSCCDSSSS